MTKTKAGSASRFGARYGKRLRIKVLEVEKKYRNIKLNCPYCAKKQVKRFAPGIWHCRSCDSKFTGKAYEI